MHALAFMLSVLSSAPPAAPPAARIAVLLEDPAGGSPATAAVERALQERGFEVVAPEIARELRDVLAPEDVLSKTLPDSLSVFEADAVIGGSAAYGDPASFEGVSSVPVALTVRLVDLATGEATATLQAQGVGVGVGGPQLGARGAKRAVDALFSDQAFAGALGRVGQMAGSILLVVNGLPDRAALTELMERLERALAGAPVREIYFARGLGKVVLGGAKSERAMRGPDVADLLSASADLPLAVEEVANTRILARFDRARTVRVHALVIEPRTRGGNREKGRQLGHYLATELATFEFVRASYQDGRLGRKAALARARAIDADVVVESEILDVGGSSALALRVIDARSGRPILRSQSVLEGRDADLRAARALLDALAADLPDKLHLARANRGASPSEPAPTAKRAADGE